MHVQVERYGLGTRRSLQEFWEHVGVDFKLKEVSPRALRGGLPDEAAFL
jgi:Glycosyltransferase (GlcNAc)